MKALETIPRGVLESAEMIDRLDNCLLHGFARLGAEQRESLGEFAAVFTGSPLEDLLDQAISAVGRSEFVVRHFQVQAGARVALLGASYDSLRAQAIAALGRNDVDCAEPPPVALGTAATLMGSTQQWLMELALAGFKHLEENSVAPFLATLEHLQAVPELTGLSALLTGFVHELLQSVPTQRQATIPLRRWADLWSAAMSRTQQMPAPSGFSETGGTLKPLGFDLQCHPCFVSAVLYALLDNGAPRSVRVPFVSYKVDVINGPELWDLFGPVAEPVLEALAEHRSLSIQKAELRQNGDLILRTAPKLAEDLDPFEVTNLVTTLPALPALCRHPVHIAEIARVPAGSDLPLASERLHANTEFTDKVLKNTTEWIGLLRFDQGGWRIQPLCARAKKGYTMSGEGMLEARSKLKNRSLATLRERASRLLRRA